MNDKPEQSDKTEEASDRKLRQARSEGQVAKSREVEVVGIILVILIVLTLFAPALSTDFLAVLLSLQSNLDQVPVAATPTETFRIIGAQVSGVALALAIVFSLLVAAALFAAFSQGSVVFAPKKVQPKLSNISIPGGFKRLFSINTFVELIKGIVKIGAVGTAVAIIFFAKLDDIQAAATFDFNAVPGLMRTVSIQLLAAVLIVVVIIALLDVIFQQWQFKRQMRMTRQEVKDEHRQVEGDPHVRRRLREIRNQRARQRMMAAVPDSTVVVTNPTHYAVCLKYAPEKSNAPICVAKGVDFIAAKIRQVAEANDVPLVANPPLARVLYETVDIDDEIPEEHYKAVAEVIIYVNRLKESRQGV